MKKHSKPHRKRIFITAFVSFSLLIFSASITAYAMNSRTVVILDDDKEMTWTTTKTDAYDILRTKEIMLDNNDYLDLRGFREEGDCVIRIYRVKKVWLIEDGERRRVSCAGSVGRLLEENGIVLGERDKLNYARSDRLQEGMEIVVNHAFDIAVLDYGNDYTLTLTEGTVAQALELCGLTLDGEDFVLPEPATPLAPGMTIHVSRIAYRERTKISTIDYETENRQTGDLALGVVQTQQKGKDGKKETVYTDKYVNGERVDSTVLRTEIIAEPVKEIKLIGTRAARLKAGLTPISRLKVPSSVEIVNGIPKHYKSVVVGTAKAYSDGLMTASGLPPQPGHIAVDPNQFPYGTKLWIVSNDGQYVYGYAIAADTGGFVRNRSCTVDLYMPNEAMCNQWGHRGVSIYVLDEPRLQTPYRG
ncbi:MAG: G5 domain-containing protein [Oscillospiraceae bacterium]|jgi:uncharacterized protein YabE (DUF348 family)/3D (Asp-Asp-Asp) domain-containing protein|nr:G5 domain-containing protein [Oscillospiraceae bacterium]